MKYSIPSRLKDISSLYSIGTEDKIGGRLGGRTSAMTAFIGMKNAGHRIREPEKENPVLLEAWHPLLPAMDVW